MKPFITEQIGDEEFEHLARVICLRPGMYVEPRNFGSVCAYLQGFNAARGGAPLMGFHQWLVVRANEGNNLHWAALARQQLANDADDLTLSDDEREIQALGQLLAEYFEFRKANGITKVFYSYARWLLRRSWYTGPLRRQP